MEKVDRALEQRVWKRVRAEEQPAPPALQALAAAEQNQAAVYLMLSRQAQGREKELLRRLFAQEQDHAATLRGIHWAISGNVPSVRTLPPEPDGLRLALRKCYGRTLQALAEYEGRCGDKEYGAVFGELARQEREHCTLILQLLGTSQRSASR